MLVREFLENIQGSVTIIKKCVSKESTIGPLHDTYYVTTPISFTDDWLSSKGRLLDYIVINPNHPPIDVTGLWINQYNRGNLACFICISKDDFNLLYKDEGQNRDMLAHYDKLVKDYLNKRK